MQSDGNEHASPFVCLQFRAHEMTGCGRPWDVPLTFYDLLLPLFDSSETVPCARKEGGAKTWEKKRDNILVGLFFYMVSCQRIVPPTKTQERMRERFGSAARARQPLNDCSFFLIDFYTERD
nr:hypothetical protein [Pandoravirus massiliensis]